MKKKIVYSLFIFLIVIIVGGFYYLNDYYEADEVALEIIQTDGDFNKDLTVHIFGNKDATTAFVFYPGGKVEDKSYSLLLEQLASEDLAVILVKMPFHLAIFNSNAAEEIIQEMPHVKNWFIGGHSLGGAMASSYVEKNESKVSGLILLGAYSMKQVDVPSIAIYGSEDLVLSKDKLVNTPNQFEIIGGNHAYFGNYGVQDGDGEATISSEEQQRITIEKIREFINNHL